MKRAGTDSSILARHDQDKLWRAISAGPVKPFLVTSDRSGSRLTCHIAREVAGGYSLVTPGVHPRMRRDISRRVSALGFDLSIRVKSHSRHSLDKPHSLEAFLARFGAGERLYDPACVFDEAEQLVGFAAEIRHRLGDRLTGIYWNSRWRTAYVLLNEKAFVDVDGCRLRQDSLIATERSVFEASNAFPMAGVSRIARLCFELPLSSPLIPVDDASFTSSRVRDQRTPPLLQLATLARVPVLSALLGIGSAGMAVAKLPPVLSQPAPASADTVIAAAAATPIDKFGNRSATFHADSIGDVAVSPDGLSVKRNASADPTAKAAVGGDGSISRDHFFQVSSSGATFDPLPAELHQRRLDLRWLPEGERAGRGGLNASERRARPPSFPVMQPGIAGILGLSKLTEGGFSSEAYGAILREVQAHFGLPPSLQAQALLHLVNAADATPSEQGRGFSDRKLLLAESESYFEWLRRQGSQEPSRDGRDYRPYPGAPARGTRDRDCGSSC
jgi:hypothetical protein